MLVAAAFTLVGAIGCGGGGSMSKAEYVRAANRVCREAATQVKRVKAPDPGDPVSVASAGARVVGIQRSALSDLKALDPPTAAKAEMTKWVALVDQTLDQADASIQAQRDGDAAAATTANQHGMTLGGRADEIARAYGLSACGAATGSRT